MADDVKPDPSIPDLGKLVADAIAKSGDPNSALKSILAENYSLRDDLKAARSKIPGDGAIVLSGDDAKAWGAYAGLGKPSDLRKVADEHEALAGKVATYERDEVLRSVAEKTGAKFAVLKTLAGPSLVFGEAKAKDKEGKEVSIATVKDGEAQPVPFDEYAAEKWGDFLPSLKPAEGARAEPERPVGTPYRLDSQRRATPDAETDSLSRRNRMLAVGIGQY